MFDDGSSITYNEYGEVVKVAEAKGYANGDLVDESEVNELGDYSGPMLSNRRFASTSAPDDLSELVEGDTSSFSNVANVDLTRNNSYMPEGAIDNGDGTYTIDNEVTELLQLATKFLIWQRATPCMS